MLPAILQGNSNSKHGAAAVAKYEINLNKKKEHLIAELTRKQPKHEFDIMNMMNISSNNNRHNHHQLEEMNCSKYKWNDSVAPLSLDQVHKSIFYKLVEINETIADLDKDYSLDQNELDPTSYMNNQIYETLNNYCVKLNRLRARVGLCEFRSANTISYILGTMKRNTRLHQFKKNLERERARANRKLSKKQLQQNACTDSAAAATASTYSIDQQLEQQQEHQQEQQLVQNEQPQGIIEEDPNNNNNKSLSHTTMNKVMNVMMPAAPTAATAAAETKRALENQQKQQQPAAETAAAEEKNNEEELYDDDYDDVDDETKKKELENKKQPVGINFSETAKYLNKKKSSADEEQQLNEAAAAAAAATATSSQGRDFLHMKRNVSLITPCIAALSKNFVAITDEIEYDLNSLDCLLNNITTALTNDYMTQLNQIEFLVLTCEKYLLSFLFNKHELLEADILEKQSRLINAAAGGSGGRAESSSSQQQMIVDANSHNRAIYRDMMKNEQIAQIKRAMNKYIESVLTYDRSRLAYLNQLKDKLYDLKRLKEKFFHKDSTDGVCMNDFSDDVRAIAVRFADSNLVPCVFIIADFSLTLKSCIKVLVEWLNYDREFIELLDVDIGMINKKRKNLLKLKLDLNLHLNQLSYRIKLIRLNLDQKEKELNDYFKQNEIRLISQKIDFSEKRIQTKKYKEILDALRIKLDGYLSISSSSATAAAAAAAEADVESDSDLLPSGEESAQPNTKTTTKTRGNREYKRVVEKVNANLKYVEEVQLPNINKEMLNAAAMSLNDKQQQINIVFIEFKQRQYELLRANLNRIEKNEIANQLKVAASSFDRELYLLDNCFYILKEIYIHKTCADTLNKIHYGLTLPNLKFNSIEASTQSTQEANLRRLLKKSTQVQKANDLSSLFSNKKSELKLKQAELEAVDVSKTKINPSNKFLINLLKDDKNTLESIQAHKNQMAAALYLVSNIIENDWMRLYYQLSFYPERGIETRSKDTSEALSKYLRDNTTQEKAHYLLNNKWLRYNMRAKLDELREALVAIKRIDILHLLNIYLDIYGHLHKQDSIDEQNTRKHEYIDFKKRNAEILHQKLKGFFERIKQRERERNEQ